MRTVRVVGAGRAGRSMARALDLSGRWRVLGMLGRDDDLRDSANGVDLLLIATPDDAIESVARAIPPVPSTVVAHLAGSRGLVVLAPHSQRAAVHPLMTLPDEFAGAARLRGTWFAIAGEPSSALSLVGEVIDSLDGRSFTVADDKRAIYHAAAAVAANHLVALLGQVERLAAAADVPFAAFFDLIRAAVDNVERVGAAAALTGPAARGDDDTIARHLAAIDPSERPAYEAMVAEARRLAP